jgi:hypothetical protein
MLRFTTKINAFYRCTISLFRYDTHMKAIRYTVTDKSSGAQSDATLSQVKRILSGSLVLLATLEVNGSVDTAHFIITK